MCIEYFPSLNMDTVCQGDLLFTSDVNAEEVEGEKLYTFKPNAITYAIPVDHPIGVALKKAKIGIVFHTSYTGNEIATMTAKAGAPRMKPTADVFLVDNDTPMDDISVDRSILSKFEQNISLVETMCNKSGDFLDHLVDNMGTTGDKKFHVASYLKQFFNAEIRGGRSIGNPVTTLKALGAFYKEKMDGIISKLKADKAIMQRRQQLYDGLEYLAPIKPNPRNRLHQSYRGFFGNPEENGFITQGVTLVEDRKRSGFLMNAGRSKDPLTAEWAVDLDPNTGTGWKKTSLQKKQGYWSYYR